MIRSAEDARKLTNRYGTSPKVHKALTDLVQERIGNAAKNGLSQVTIEFPYGLYEVIDIDDLKAQLKDAGYNYMPGRTEGTFGNNLFREARYCITVMW